MQTFLPYEDFAASLACLDYRRLGKQRVEAKQLVDAITTGKGGWVNHPCSVMWRDYIDALKLYHNMCLDEWILRGYKNTMVHYDVVPDPEMPWWLGDQAFHDSHKSNLLRKQPDHYKQWGWVTPDNLEYIWPTAQPQEKAA